MFKKIILTSAVFVSAFTGLFADTYDGMVEKAIEHAQELGIQVSVAIVDQHGNLAAFKRMDGSLLASVKFSQGKALTSATIPMTSGSIADMNVTLPGSPLSNIPGFVLLKGAVPIVSDTGQILGAIGVAGGNPDQDESCAKAALVKGK
jgi:glc operon protein GlcG